MDMHRNFVVHICFIDTHLNEKREGIDVIILGSNNYGYCLSKTKIGMLERED